VAEELRVPCPSVVSSGVLRAVAYDGNCPEEAPKGFQGEIKA